MTNQYYPTTDANPNMAALEQGVLARWAEQGTFQASISQREGADDYVFFDGPPFANGLPHYGHLLTSCVKDIFGRYQTMQGKKVERRFGWDCHGLPAEMEAEKQLGIQGQLAILDYGVEKFNQTCRTSVMQYTQEWQDYINRQARWVDFDNEYKTMDLSFMQSVMWAFKTLYDKGLIYEGHKVMPYSWAAQTPLSNFETRMDNSYREKKSQAITVKFQLENVPEGLPQDKPCALLAWTTTPWTLPSNVALAVGEGVSYAAVEHENEILILAHSSLAHYKQELGKKPTVLAEIPGSALIGASYTPLFTYFADTPNAFKVLAGDFVEEGDGTAIVHLAPGFGEDDQRVCAEHGICTPENGGIICPVDEAGKFTKEVSDYVGMQVFEANTLIIIRLKEEGKWLKTEQYIHNYPHCWRTDTPLIYKAVPSWYVKVTAIKERMVELNKEINWIPGHIRDGLFGKWLENAHDWAISRNRFWGAPIPIWKSNNPDNDTLYVFGTLAELEAFFGVEVTDLHKPFIDTLTAADPENPEYTLSRVPEVLDCWFESGSMPFAQNGYIGEASHPDHARFTGDSPFLSDFIVEYVAQTRGWFYTLMVLSTALFDKAPFANCICHGVILDEDRQKLSKRLRNYPDPKEVYDTLGADAMRWMMVSRPVMQGGELQVSKDGSDIKDALRLSIKPIWNAYHFFTLYANADGVQAKEITRSDAVLDTYILAKLKHAVAAIENGLDAYDTTAACAAVDGFFEVLNNWYIRRSRERFWRETDATDADKQAAYDTLFTCLSVMCRAAAPLLPLTLEAVYQGLHGNEHSVHLQVFPSADAIAEDAALMLHMDEVRDICNTGLAIRNSENIRIRQPLAALTLYGEQTTSLQPFGDILSEELNVKEILFSSDLKKVSKQELKLNFPVLGKRLGKKMGQVSGLAKAGKFEVAEAGIKVGDELLSAEEASFRLLPNESLTGAAATQSQTILVALDTHITSALQEEGLARDVVRAVQQARKEADLHIADRITLQLHSDDDALMQAIANHTEYIKEQTLTANLLADAVSDNDAARYNAVQEIGTATLRIIIVGV